MDDIYTFLVRGPSSRYPRGYIWLIPIWFAVIGGVVVIASRKLSGSMPMFLGLSELGGLTIAGLTVFSVLYTLRRNAFRMNSHGIWLGIRTTRKRPKLRQVHIVWADIGQIRMVQRHYGTLVEIALGPSAHIVVRPSFGRQAMMLVGAFFMPWGFGRGRPGLTAALEYPPRYLVKLCDISPAELRAVFAEVKPPDLPVRTLTRRSTMRIPQLPSRPTAQPTGGPALIP